MEKLQGLLLDPYQGWEGGGLEVPLSCHPTMWVPHRSRCARIEAWAAQELCA